MSSDTRNPKTAQQSETIAQALSKGKLPDWLRNANRVDRPAITRWFRPEDGPVDGTLIWRGRQEHHQSGDVYNAYAVREAGTGIIIGISERVGLRDLRTVKVGSRVFINLVGVKQLDNGRTLQRFEIFAEAQEPLSDPTKGGARNDNGGPSDAGPAGSEGILF